MKIVFVIDSLSVGGGTKVVHDLAVAQKQLGNSVEVLAICQHQSFIVESLKQKGIKVNCIYKEEGKLRNPFTVFKLDKYLKDADVVHVNLFPALYWCAIHKFLFRRKFALVVTEHSTHNRRRDRWYFRPIERFIYKQYDAIVGCSPKAGTALGEYLGREDVISIANGVDIEQYSSALPYSKAELLGEEWSAAKMLLMVAHFWKPKDPDTIIRALSLLEEDVVAVLVGDGEDMDKSKALAKELGVEQRCFFLGERSDVDRLVNTADINILSSEWEGLPLSCIESMAAGKPFIGSEVNGIKEIVDDAGLLFEYGNHHQLAEQIKTLLADDTLYNNIAAKCKERAMDYDFASCGEKYDELYHFLLEK